jgi:epsilon-lactone hydrolase
MSPSTWPWVKQHYVGDAALTDPEVSPLFGDWAHLAPLHFHVSSTEILLDDSVRAAHQARNSGTDAQISIWEDVPHSFPFIDGMTVACACRHQIAAFAGKALAR